MTTVHDLGPDVRDWPPVLKNVGGQLMFDGCSVSALADEYGTPAWLLSLSTVAANHRMFKETWADRYPDIELSYSLKANNALAILRTLATEGAYFDCSGEAEFEVVQRAGGDASKCILNGNGKSLAVLEMAARSGCRQVNIDSIGEVHRLAAIAREAGAVVDCTVRVILGYSRMFELDPDFEAPIRMWEGKFGTSTVSGESMRVIEAILGSPNLRFVGLHHHVGFSGTVDGYQPDLDVMHHRESVSELCEFANTVETETGYPIARLDLGGGFPRGDAMYLAGRGNVADGALWPLPPLATYADVISGVVRDYFPEDALPTLQFEAGQWHVSDAAVLVSRVTDVKNAHSEPPRRFITVDTNMYQFVSKGFTRLGSQAYVVNRMSEPPSELVADVVGQTCAYDSVVEDVYLPDSVDVDDLMLFTGHGAYSDVSGCNFNSIPRPAVIAVDGSRSAVARRHETVDDVIRRCAGPDLEWRTL